MGLRGPGTDRDGHRPDEERRPGGRHHAGRAGTRLSGNKTFSLTSNLFANLTKDPKSYENVSFT